MRFLPVNLNAMLVELDNLAQTLALRESLAVDPIPGIEEFVPAARTILITFRPAAVSAEELVRRISLRRLGQASTGIGPLVEIPVHYDGEDLDEVAHLLSIAPAELVRRHTGSEYTVAFAGFAPGFAYLVGGHPSLNVPRRATSRTRIPAGAVGLASTFSAVYPQASPGGWQIIGVTHTRMWDLKRQPPALLQPGFRVRFVDAGVRSVADAEQEDNADMQNLPRQHAGAALEIRASGLQTLFQDLGRGGHAGQGVASSGAMDRAALMAANRLVGNPSDMACLEIVAGGFSLVCRGNAVVAVTGADAPLGLTDGDSRHWPAERYQAIALTDGDTLAIGHPRAGVRCYLAVRGGFEVTPVLDSCATDTLARVGPKPIMAGDILPLCTPRAPSAAVALNETPPPDLPTAQDVVTLDVVMGPRTDWFTEQAIELLHSQPWQVTPQSDRIGLRLAGAQPLQRVHLHELPSEGTSIGAIQVPASGLPVLFMADHPLTGGYPVIATVATYHLDRAGQIPVNAWVRFNPITDFEPQQS